MKVVFLDMPYDIDGYTVESSEDGEMYYTIILNSRLSAERQFAAFRHELEHIERSDFDKARELGISIVEHDAHERAGIRQ